ncbi:formylmethanofuran dehydrogenase subunit C [Methylosinus sp. Sm6]|uniref:formylmethanofuran dehydrogenase subunit C n=1 Tax=Methylosinus sp. Sm6 TaxID=2866948 RepID=UPI001C9983E1|nr:formylmethanofuran dehydrogenase subunit C [Methylosinus sp. Sm6]
MKPLLFTLKAEPDQRLDLSLLTPDRLVGRSAKEIEGISIGTTRETVTVGDLFKVRLGEATSVRFDGGSDRFDLLGAKLLPGFEIHVEGDVGAQLGRSAKGGTITVAGDAGPYAASQSAGALIDIYGDAGDFLGGPLAGEIPGMSGGRVIVRGSVGARCGDRLRRGIIIVEGDAGDDLGSRAIAGTIIVLGEAGERIGYLNKRASIVLSEQRALGPTYVDCGAHNLGFAKLFAKSLAPESRGASRLLSGRLQRFAGDTAVYGKGEILVPA